MKHYARRHKKGGFGLPLGASFPIVILTVLIIIPAGNSQEPRYGRTYGMFGERILGQPIRPPQPRFSQGIERSRDGMFQGIRPPGSVVYPRSEAAREAREFRSREWLTPEGNWSWPRESPATQWVEPYPATQAPLPPAGAAEVSGESSAGETPAASAAVESQTASPGESPSSEAETAPAGERPAVPVQGEASLPPPSRWVNSTQAPRRTASTATSQSRSRQLVPAENWREVIRSYLRESAEARLWGAGLWEKHLAERLNRALEDRVVGPLRVTVQQGVATLEGKVRGTETPGLAARILMLEPGIFAVDNRLEVLSP
jgi:hypothetical protein